MAYMKDSTGRRLDDFPVAQAGDSDVVSVASSRPVKGGEITNDGSLGRTQSLSTRLSEVAPFDIVAVRLVYKNWQNLNSCGESPNYNGIHVGASIHLAGVSAPNRAKSDPAYPVFFNGSPRGYVDPCGELKSDWTPVKIAQGERWWHETIADTFLPAGPSAPTLTATSGGNLGNGTTYYIVLKYIFADGTESLPSAESSVTTSGSNLTITVTSPTGGVGVIGYRTFIGTTAAGVKYEYAATPMAPIGTNATITASQVTDPTMRTARDLARVGLPQSRGLLGGLNGATSGEAQVSGRDYTIVPVDWGGFISYGSLYMPSYVEAIAADGRRHKSVALLGDSIIQATGDNGFGGNLGGFGYRACANQTEQIAFDLTKTPHLGFMQLGQGGEAGAAFAGTGGARRRRTSEAATSILNNYGRNDLLSNGSAPWYVAEMKIFNYYAGRKDYFRATIIPKAASTDGYATIANQSYAEPDREGDRRAINRIITGTSGSVVITNDVLFRAATGTSPATNVYSGGDGTTTRFVASYPFRAGTETVKVNGTTKALTTDYTYYGTATDDAGVTWASGFNFVAAPGNGLSVTASYTKAPSLGSFAGYSGYFDVSGAFEVNAAGVAGLHGGWWPPATPGVGDTGTATSTTSGLVNDTTKAWTGDQWRGMAVMITADASTPTAVGQVVAIQSNTATQLKLSAAFTVTPSATASYKIFQPYTIDGTHPESIGHLKMSQAIDTDRF